MTTSKAIEVMESETTERINSILYCRFYIILLWQEGPTKDVLTHAPQILETALTL